MNEYRGAPVQMLSGEPWYPYSPRVEDVRIEDLRAMLNMPRWGALVPATTWNLIDHSVMVWRVARELYPQGDWLFLAAAGGHDGHEAYPPYDQPAPFLRDWDNDNAANLVELERHHFDGIAKIVRLAKTVFRKRFGLDAVFRLDDLAGIIKDADAQVAAAERRDFVPPAAWEWKSAKIRAGVLRGHLRHTWPRATFEDFVSILTTGNVRAREGTILV